MALRYGSVCSGIEAASVAWEPLGWQPQWFSEIEPFPSAVLAHRWPGVPNYGDFTKIGTDAPGIDLLVGGTPCQSFSVAGLRRGLDDDRGNLALEFLRLAQRLRPRWVVWENVPGVLSSGGGRDFGSILGALVELGYGFAYRVLDAQHVGVPQRRRRVFVVGYLGDWRPPAAVLFEPESLRRSARPGRDEEQDAAAAPAGSAATTGGVLAFNAEGSTGLPFFTRSNIGKILNNQTPLILAFHIMQDPISGPVSPSVVRKPGGMGVLVDGRVRRFTPREVERLFGFPDDYTLVPFKGKLAADAKRYGVLGNSMAVPVMRLIGARMEVFERVAAGLLADPNRAATE